MELDWSQAFLGAALVAAGSVLALTGIGAMSQSIRATPIAEPQVIEERKPPELPPMGEPIGAMNNEMWELRDGSIAQISGAPDVEKNRIIGWGQTETIDEQRGWTMTQMLFWRLDGVNIYGEPEGDLWRRRPDLQPVRHYNEDGYVTRIDEPSAGECEAECG